MKTLHHVAVALAIGVASGAQAQESITIVGSPLAADPSAFIGEDSGSFYLSRQATTSWRKRADVVAETAAARRDREAAALVSEDSGSMYFASLPLGPGVERAAVVADLDRARASGELAARVSEDSGSAWLSRMQRSQTTTAANDGGASARQTALAPSTGGTH